MNDFNGKYLRLSEVKTSEIEWLWKPYIPCGKVSVLQGDPGCGKSMMMLDLISRFTTGRCLPGGQFSEPINVIYQCSEDGLEDTIRPRLVAAKADCRRVSCINEDLNAVTLDNEILKQAIIDLDAKLLVIDPFQAYIGDSDLSSALGMRRVLRKLSMWASEYKCAVVLVGHLNKKSGQKELYRGLGSVDIMALARSVMQLEISYEGSQFRTLKHVKASLTSLANDLYFGINDKGEFEWSEDESVFFRVDDPSDIVSENENLSGKKMEQAAKMILQILSDGQKPAKLLMDVIEREGICARTIKRAKIALDVSSIRKDGVWYWSLPEKK